MNGQKNNLKINVSDVKNQALGRWDDILMSLAGDKLDDAISLHRTNKKKHTFCPVHGGKNGDAFRLSGDFLKTGGSVCNTCGFKPDGFDTLSFVNGISFADSIKLVNEYLNGNITSVYTPKVREKIVKSSEYEESSEKSIRRINSIWEKSISITDKEALPLRLYFEGRCMDFDKFVPSLNGHHDKILRFHRGIPLYGEDFSIIGLFPALIYKFFNPQGKTVTIHRIYFNKDGTKIKYIDKENKLIKTKRLVTIPKGLSLTGAACRLGPVINGELGIAEGFETSVSARQFIDGQHNVWPVYNDTVMQNFVIPDNVHTLYIWADKDSPQNSLDGLGAGEFYAKKLIQNNQGRDVKFKIMLPHDNNVEKLDWNDIICSGNKHYSVISDETKNGSVSFFENLRNKLSDYW